MRIIKPPARIPTDAPRPWVFLAGAIDQGKAVDWQSTIQAALMFLPGTILNPRRDAWDATWVQDVSNPLFVEQVTWELDALEQADAILLWLPRESQAPISLLELGLHARGGRLVVGCEPGYHRRGNVQVVCARWDIPLSHSLDGALGHLLQLVPELRDHEAVKQISFPEPL